MQRDGTSKQAAKDSCAPIGLVSDLQAPEIQKVEGEDKEYVSA